MRLAGIVALGGAAAAIAACELITRSSAYGPYQGVCNACANPAADLRRPPCPPNVPPDDAIADGGPIHVYAWHTFSIGGDPATVHDPAYDVGYDQDCSTRADGGRPAWCVPYSQPPDDAILGGPWWPLPHGVDNSLGQRVVAPLIAFGNSIGVAIDIDGTVTRSLQAGTFGEVVVVEGWNGTPDDADVTVSFIGSQGTGGVPPTWQGNDVWIANAPVGTYLKFPGYVTGGVLVVDTRSVGEDDLTVTLPDRNGNPVSFQLAGRLTVRAATLTPEAMTLVSYGRWNLTDALAQVSTLVGFWAGSPDDGGNAVAGILQSNLPDLFRAAADLPLGEASTPGGRCAALSLAFRTEALPALVTNPP